MYPGTEFRGLNHPAIQKIYLDEIEEVGARYGRYAEPGRVSLARSGLRRAPRPARRRSRGILGLLPNHVRPVLRRGDDAAQGRRERSLVAAVRTIQDPRGEPVGGPLGRGRPASRPGHELLLLHAGDLRRGKLAMGLRHRRPGAAVRPAVVLRLHGRVGQALSADPRGLARFRPKLPRTDSRAELRLCHAWPAGELLRIPHADLPGRNAPVLLGDQEFPGKVRRYLHRLPGPERGGIVAVLRPGAARRLAPRHGGLAGRRKHRFGRRGGAPDALHAGPSGLDRRRIREEGPRPDAGPLGRDGRRRPGAGKPIRLGGEEPGALPPDRDSRRHGPTALAGHGRRVRTVRASRRTPARRGHPAQPGPGRPGRRGST